MTQIEYHDIWSDKSKQNTGKLSLFNHIKLALQKQVPQLIGGLDPANMAKAADVSHWNGDIDVSKMGIDFLWIKACDGKPITGTGSDLNDYVDDKLYRNVQQAYDNKKPCGIYCYVQWNILPGTSNHGVALHHFKILKKAIIGSLIPGKSFHAIALDVEERGASAPNMAEIVLTLWKMIADDPTLSALPIYIYTSISVLDQYVNLREQISWQGANYNGKPFRLWMAQWAWNSTPRITTTWELIIPNFISKLSMKVITPGYAPWNWLQVAANFILPGCTVNITDLNLFRGTRAALYLEINYTGQVEPPPPPDDETGEVTRIEFDALAARVTECEVHKHTVSAPVKP